MIKLNIKINKLPLLLFENNKILRFIKFKLSLMLRNFLQRVEHLKQYIGEHLKRKNIFEINQMRTYTSQEVIKCIRFALGSNATDYKSFLEVEYHLSVIIYYLKQGQSNEGAEELLSLEEQALWLTPKYVLYRYQKYLESVMPTNITYYHFIREKEFYTQYVAIKYILVVGLHQLKQNQHIFLKIKTNQKLQIFSLLLEWLLTFIQYRCSAIYIKSHCVDPLICQAHLLLSALLGYDGNSILSSLLESELKDVVNKMFYIESFLLAMAIPTKNHLQIQVVINTLRKLMTSVHQQKIFMYLPSYLYANLIGFIKVPYTTEIIYRLIVFFLTQNQNQRQGSSSADVLVNEQQCNQSHLITECWSLLSLLVEEYELDKSVCKELILQSIGKLENRSMDRAFILRIANNLHLDLEEERIHSFINTQKQPYVVGDKVIKPEVFVKNYPIAIQQHYYLKIIFQAAKGRWQSIPLKKLWEFVTCYNKYDILTMDEYLYQLKPAQSKE